MTDNDYPSDTPAPTTKASHALFMAVWHARSTPGPEKTEVPQDQRVTAMELEAAGLIRVSGGRGKNFAKCTALGRQVGNALFEVS